MPKIDSVLARFEKTIEENNEAGVTSGMYLASRLAKDSRPHRASVSYGARGQSMAGGGGAASRRPSMAEVGATPRSIKPGMYRSMLKDGEGTVATARMSDREWDPFNEKRNSSDGRFGDYANNEEDSSSFEEDDDFAHEEDFDFFENEESVYGDEPREEKAKSSSSLLKKRPTKLKSAGRKAQRKTRVRTRNLGGDSSSHDKRSLNKSEHKKKEKKEEEEEEEDDGFAVTYVKKYADELRDNAHSMKSRKLRDDDLGTSAHSNKSTKKKKKSSSKSKEKSSTKKKEDASRTGRSSRELRKFSRHRQDRDD